MLRVHPKVPVTHIRDPRRNVIRLVECKSIQPRRDGRAHNGPAHQQAHQYREYSPAHSGHPRNFRLHHCAYLVISWERSESWTWPKLPGIVTPDELRSTISNPLS